MFVSKPVEDRYEIHDTEIEILPMKEGDAGAAKKTLELVLSETKESTEFNLNSDNGVIFAETDILDNVQHTLLNGSRTAQRELNINNINETNNLLDCTNESNEHFM